MLTLLLLAGPAALVCTDTTCTCPTGVLTQVVDPDFNGCGSEGATGLETFLFNLFIPRIDRETFEMMACLNHDICYSTCGTDRDVCDATFRQEMLEACEDRSRYPRFWKRKRCKRSAKKIFLAVSVGGAGPFTAAQTAACACVTE